MPNGQKNQRPIDKMAKETFSWWDKSFVFIKKTQIKTWQAVFVIAFIAGGAVTLIWSISNNIHPFSSARILDTDEDGLTDTQEAQYGTNPNNPDTDGDGYLDGEEVKMGYNPLGQGKLSKLKSSGTANVGRNYIEGEIIVKIKDNSDLGAIVDELIKRKQAFSTIINNNNLDNLNKKYKVKKASRVFANVKKGEIPSGVISLEQAKLELDNMRKNFSQKVESINKKFTARTKHSPKGVQTSNLGEVYKIEFEDKSIDIKSAISEYGKDANIEYAEPNLLLKTQMIPSDPYYSSANSWGQGYDDLWGLKKLQTDRAWDISQGEGIVVAVVDTGIDYSHKDIAANVWKNSGEIPNNGIDDDNNGYVDDYYGYNFAYYNNNPKDDHGHGTHCAGTIAAISNSIGIIGVAPKAKVMAVKGLDSGGSGGVDILANALKYAADNGADVISNSWGGQGVSLTLEDAVNYAYNLGSIVVAAAGNDGIDASKFTPANIANVITVAASDHNDNRADFSNWGDKVDVAAPGGDSQDNYDKEPYRNVLSLRAAGTDMYGDQISIVGTNYYRSRGTSMACPHVAGLASLILAKNHSWNQEQVRRALKQGVDPIISDYYVGAGRINAEKALQINTISNGIASIIAPKSNSVVTGKIDISGTAYDDNFVGYSLYYGQGVYPASWNLIYSSTNTVQNGVLYSGFDSSVLIDGDNTLKLIVTDTDGLKAEAISIINFKTMQITEPLSLDIFKAGSTIKINGSINKGESYFVEYGEGENPALWSSDHIILTNGGVLPVSGTNLAIWDTSFVSQSGYYSLRITVNKGSQQFQKLISDIFLDTNLRSGWPQRIPWFRQSSIQSKENNKGLYLLGSNNELIAQLPKLSVGDNARQIISFLDKDGKENFIKINGANATIEGSSNYKVSSNIFNTTYYWPGGLEPVVADVNNDGKKEMFIYTAGNPPKIYGFNEDGSYLAGWPIEVKGVDIGGGNISVPTIADIDNDGYGEIIVNGGNSDDWWAGDFSKEGLYIYNHDGSFSRMINLPVTDNPHTETVVADINHDGKKEIIRWYGDIIENNEKIAVMDAEGNMLPGWPQVVYHQGINSNMNVKNTPAVGDIDNDGNDEIIIATIRYVLDTKEHYEGRIYAFKLDGSNVFGFPKDIPGIIFASPALADIDNDNYYKEIIVHTANINGIPTNGKPGTYVIKNSGSILSGWPKLVALGQNISGASSVLDGWLVPVVPSFFGQIFLFNNKGVVQPGWPQDMPGANLRGATIGDITGDKVPDIITSVEEGYGSSLHHSKIFAWDIKGLLLNNFPKITEMWPIEVAPTITDLDNDGKTELVASSNWDYTGVYFKARGSIYVWDLDKPYDASTMDWPMVNHDTQHTGNFSTLRKSLDINPPTGTIKINSGKFYATSTTNILTLSASDAGSGMGAGAEMKFSEDNINWTMPEPYAINKSWTLSEGDGLKTVYVKFKDVAGNWSKAFKDTITLDTVKPELTNLTDSLDPFSPTTGQTSTISFTLSEPSYVTIKIYNSAGTAVRGLLPKTLKTALNNSIVWDGKNNSGIYVPSGIYTYNIWVIDKAGNNAEPYTQSGTIEVKMGTVAVFCGDKSCNGAETCLTCSADCGACPPPSIFCTDSDGGKNYTQAGTCQDASGYYSDTCDTSDGSPMIKEFYCDMDHCIADGYINCNLQLGNSCVNGACVASSTPQL